MINADQLRELKIGAEWVDPLNATFAKFGMVDIDQQAAFIGQCTEECGHFTKLEENLNYSAKTLDRLFGHKFKPGEIELYAGNAQKIANRIYGGRMGNRDESSGDGWKYRGRGCIQLTGHDNYWHFGQSVGQDFVSNPDPVGQPYYAAMSAGWFWKTHGCNEIADREDWIALTKRVNGGDFGLKDRIAFTNKALQVLRG
jgi:putative chitinase